MLIKPVLQNGALLADVHAASNGGDRLHVWWLGQSGFLIKCAGEFLLLDPYLSDSLHKRLSRTDRPHARMTDIPLSPEKLDMVGVALSSHQYGDHFDEDTLRPLATASGQLKLILPEATVAQARRRLPNAAIEYIPMNDGQSLTVDGWEFTGVASAHGEIERDDTGRCLYLGYLIRRNGITLYHAGSTRWHDGLIEPLRLARCDLMLLPINGYKPERRVPGNLNGMEAAALAKACGAGLVVPCHYEMFKYDTDTTEEFVRACGRLDQAHHLMRCGGRLTIGKR